MDKKTIYIVVIIAVLLVAAIALSSKKVRQTFPSWFSAKNTQQIPKVTKVEVPKSQAPAGFPSDLPIEKGAVLTQNFEADTSVGQHQATRQFESKKTVSENYALYADYFKTSGWTVLAKSPGDTLSTIAAKKGEGSLTVNISKDPAGKKVTVDLSFVTKKK